MDRLNGRNLLSSRTSGHHPYGRTMALVLAGAALFLAGYVAGITRPTRTAHAQTHLPQDTESLFEPLWETWQLLHTQYVDQPIDDASLMQGAVRGMVETLQDQHTAYMTPAQFALLEGDLSGQFDGIGAQVEQDEDGRFIILSSMEGSPAQAAGLLPGDRILAVDGEDVREKDQMDVLSRVRGPAGTSVTLTMRRSGVPGSFDVMIVRDTIDIEEVQWRMVDNDFAYVKLTQFTQSANTDLHTGLQDALTLQPRGLILDLRGNSGGLLNVAIDITSEFIGSGPIMVERWGDGRERVYQANGEGLATEIPLVVLVDEGSASASEVLAAAIQDRQRGLVVGETTFGKGTVQNWQELSDGSGVRITIARWVSSEGTTVHEVGLEPDVMVAWSGTYPDQPEDDVQLNAAIDVLRGQTLWPTWPLPWLDAVSLIVAG